MEVKAGDELARGTHASQHSAFNDPYGTTAAWGVPKLNKRRLPSCPDTTLSPDYLSKAQETGAHHGVEEGCAFPLLPNHDTRHWGDWEAFSILWMNISHAYCFTSQLVTTEKSGNDTEWEFLIVFLSKVPAAKIILLWKNRRKSWGKNPQKGCKGDFGTSPKQHCESDLWVT